MLTDPEKAVLRFERNWWKYAGQKEQSIRDLFDITATRYYQQLNSLIDRPDALAFDPQLIKRLQSIRAKRQRERTARALG